MRATSFCYCFYPSLTVGYVAPAYKDINMIYITTLCLLVFFCFLYHIVCVSFLQLPSAIEIPSRKKPNPQIKLLFMSLAFNWRKIQPCEI